MNQEEKLFIVSVSPHIRKEGNISRIMFMVIIALIPAVIASVYFFSFLAVKLIVTCVLTALVSEWLVQKIRKKKITISDGSAFLTGLLLALTLPPGLPLVYACLGTVFAIVIGKQLFGGLGYNFFNPALLGRAFLMAAFPVLMTTWTNPFTLDAVSGATPLAFLKFGGEKVLLGNLFWGNVSGCLGETSAFALLIGAVILLAKKIIDWRIPATFLGVVILFSGIFHFISPEKNPSPLWHLFAGGLMLGAFFMATDYVTSPVTKKGRLIFGLGCGLILMIIRFWGGLPEGVMYSILLMNAFTPLINRLTRPKKFGREKKK